MDTPNADKNWLTLRNMVPRWGIWTSGLVNLLVLTISAIALWWVFFSNSGIFKLYTPLLGFSLVIWMLLIIMWQTEFFDYWPFSNQFLTSAHPLKKGGILTGTTLLLYLVLIFGILFFIIGQYGVTYFNWHSLTKYGKLGQDVMSTRETTSWSFICLSVPFLWITTVLLVGVGKDIWPKDPQPGQGLANWLLMAMLSIPLFLIFFHPHIGSMFYPAQIYTAVPPWWKHLAHTNSAEYGLGILFCTVIVIFITLQLWEGRPWNLVEKQPWKVLFIIVGGLVLGFIFFRIQLSIMEYFWDEAYIGGQNDANFGWRYSHTVTMGNFILVPAIILKTYFGQAFAKMSLWLKGFLTTGIAIIAGLIFAWCYYAWAPALLGVCSGVSHPSENPSAFLVMLIVLLNIHDYFMDGWPGYLVKNPGVDK
jgi:AAT family amino acid transporter